MKNDMARLYEKLEALMEKSDIPWWEWDIRKNIVKFNPLKVTALGYRVEDFSGSGYQAFTSLIHPDDYERSMDAMRDHLSGKAEIYQIDYRIKDVSGKWHWYLDRGAVTQRDASGSPLVLRGIVLDMGYYFNKESFETRLVEIFRREKQTTEYLKKGFVVLCSNCRKIKISENDWEDISENFVDDAGLQISHSICSDCLKLLYPDMAEEILSQ